MAQRVPSLTRPGRDLRPGLLIVSGLAIYVGLVYTVVVLGGGVLAAQTGSPNLGLSVLATAIVAIGFESVQTRLEGLATGALDIRASPYEILSRFAGTTRTDDESADLPARMSKLLAEGTGAVAAQVWLVVAERPTLAASWPSSTPGGLTPPDLTGRTDGACARPWRSLPVREGGELLGVLRLQESDERPLTPVEERLFAGLAAQAGLVLRSARLRAELSQRLLDLSARADELRASRERLIETQDQERQKLERDIHDGAQQHLVALAVNLRLAEALAEALAARSPERAAKVMAEQSEAAQQAIDTLTQLSRGIYPALLAQQGLVPALLAVAATSVLTVEVTADQTVRCSPEVEAALYFCCLEALQNAAKHSGGGRASVWFGTTPQGVGLTVSDDGRGFAPASIQAGAGTANMRDRIDAVGGTFTVDAGIGRGTRIEARIPITAAGSRSS